MNSTIEAPAYAREFPDYPADEIPLLGDGWRDTSWHNDGCPSFIHEPTGLALWCDYADPAKRECPESPRYVFVQLVERDPEADWQHSAAQSVVLACSSLTDVRDVLEHAADGATLPHALQSARMRLNQLTASDARELLAAELRHGESGGKACPDLVGAMRATMASDPRAMTLDGEPARMRLGSRFGFISRRDGKGGDVEFSISAIASVLASGGRFQS